MLVALCIIVGIAGLGVTFSCFCVALETRRACLLMEAHTNALNAHTEEITIWREHRLTFPLWGEDDPEDGS